MSQYQLLPSWSKAQTSKLLEELQKHPVLYDQAHPLYEMRDVRLSAFRKIIDNIKHIKPNMTPQLISRKIRVLKCQYWKEKKLIRDSLTNLRQGETPYKPKLWCFNMLSFFDKTGAYEHDQHPGLSEESDGGDVSDIIEECYVDEKPYPISTFEEVEVDAPFENGEQVETTVTNKTRNELHLKCLKLVDCLTDEMKTLRDQKASELCLSDGSSHNQKPLSTFLGQMVESELAKVSEEIYDEAKWKIIHILEEASKKNREAKSRPVQINPPSKSVAAPSRKKEYNLSEETRGTVYDNAVFKTPYPASNFIIRKLNK